MYMHYDWIAAYLKDAPSLEEMAQMLNETGLETEIEDGGLEIEHTVNRPDAMSHYGVARELSVKAGLDLIDPPIYEGVLGPLEGWKITSDDVEQCPQYIGVKVENVRASASPDWLKARLDSIGQTSHNVLVDLTNFLLWEYGHPSHAFDATKLAGQEIRVRWGTEGEELTTLDGREHKAHGMLCIADAEKPVAFAGVMGGENSEVDSNTTTLLLELAVFNPVTVRRTGRDCNIQSDAKHRFERGVDRENMDRVIRRFLYLLLQDQPDAQIIGMLDMNMKPFERESILLRREKLDNLLGIHLESELVFDLLTRQGFQPQVTSDGWQVFAPGYKVDVTREADVIEEVIRFVGFDRLESTLPRLGGSDLSDNPRRQQERRLRELLATFAYQETCTYSFVREDWDNSITETVEAIRLRNPMTENQAVMRRHLLPSLLECVRYNVSRGNQDLALFEVGRVFHGDREPRRLAVVRCGGDLNPQWFNNPAPAPFYAVKGVFETLVQRLGWQDLSLRQPAAPHFRDGEALGIYHGNTLIGGLGHLQQKLLGAFDIEADIAVLEMDLGFLDETPLPIAKSEALSIFPGITIDMAFVVDKVISFGEMEAFIAQHPLEHLERLSLFDVYAGKALPKDKKSLGFRFAFRAQDRSLTREEVSARVDALVDSIKAKFNATIRE
jgi:phenylalanyl-tRNA synthetase beta chain